MDSVTTLMLIPQWSFFFCIQYFTAYSEHWKYQNSLQIKQHIISRSSDLLDRARFLCLYTVKILLWLNLVKFSLSNSLSGISFAIWNCCKIFKMLTCSGILEMLQPHTRRLSIWPIIQYYSRVLHPQDCCEHFPFSIYEPSTLWAWGRHQLSK